MTGLRRQIRNEERELLIFLAGSDSDFREPYLRQLRDLSEIEDWQDGTRSFYISDVKGYGVRMNARAQDEDGTPIEIILFARNNILCALELSRPDLLPIRRFPRPEELTDIWDADGNPRPKGW